MFVYFRKVAFRLKRISPISYKLSLSSITLNIYKLSLKTLALNISFYHNAIKNYLKFLGEVCLLYEIKKTDP